MSTTGSKNRNLVRPRRSFAQGVGAGLIFLAFVLMQAPAPGAVPIVSAQEIAGTTVGIAEVKPAQFNGDVRNLPQVASPAPADFELDEPLSSKVPLAGSNQKPETPNKTLAPMPSPIQNFAGIARTDTCVGGQCGAGTPPDTNGDVGRNHYIQAVNSAYAIYSKTGTLLASFTENSLFSGGPTGTVCDANSRGDPVVVYDQFADRWFLTNFAFALSGSNFVAPFYQCFAVSKTSDPVSGGWWLYAVRVDDGSHPWLNDYPKFGNWNDGCLYMSANEFTTANTFAGTLFASLSKSAMESGTALGPSNAAVGFIVNSNDPFTMIPSNISGATAAASLPPASTPNYFVSESQNIYAFEVRKFTPGAGCGGGGTLSTATNVTQASYSVPGSNIVPQPSGGNTLDSLGDRMMQKVQYRKVGSAESLWVTHTFRASAGGVTGSQWAQINVTGGTIATTAVQQQLYDPADGRYRWMSSLAVDHFGNMAIGYSTSSSVISPTIAYAGRLVGDTLGQLPQSEVQLVAGLGVQNGLCGGAPCHRWGDYSAMSVDPVDDCTFWYTSEYYPTFAVSTVAWSTRIGSFRFPTCRSMFLPLVVK